MAQNLLYLTNEVLRKVGFITGESGTLSNLTDSARQVEIDIVKRNWNTALSELYSLSDIPYPQELDTTEITAVADQREYSLPSALLQIRYPITLEAEERHIHEYNGGYEQMRKDQRNPDSYEGSPVAAVINPINGKLRFDRIPQTAEAGNVYTVYYDKEVFLDVSTDEVPFSDTVSRHMVNVVSEDWKRDQRKEFDEEYRKKHLALAVKFLLKKQKLDTWGAVRAR